MKKPIRLTYSTVTDESAAHGDCATRGFVTRNLTIPAKTYLPKKPAQFTLREALEFCEHVRNGTHPVQADSCPISLHNPPRWFSFIREDSCGDPLSVEINLHLPRTVTPSSAMRVARLVGCYGIR